MLKKAINSIVQIIIYEILLIGMILILGEKLLGNKTMEFLCYIVLPVILAVLVCFWENRANFNFRRENIKSKYAIIRFMSRFGIVLLFLLTGCIYEILDVGNWLTGKISGIYGEMIAYIICNLNVVIVVSVFPLAYMIVELLFVSVEKNV